MKINLFKVLLYDFLISIIVNGVLYFLLILVFSGALSLKVDTGEFALMTLAETVAIVFFSFLFQVSFLLPLFYIQKRQIEAMGPQELFSRFMPLVTLIACAFVFFVMLIGGLESGRIAAEAWVNIWLIYGISYTGLISFVYLVKHKKTE
jgi:hypothetical protein